MSAPPEVLARLVGLEVRYGSAVALTIPRLDVAAGERVGVLGPSGAGKSTLLRVMMGLVPSHSGTVDVLGIDPAEASDRRGRAARSDIGYLAQSLDLVTPLSARANVGLGRVGRRRAGRVLWDLVRRSPDSHIDGVLAEVGLDALGPRRTSLLSGGEQQRVAIARVLHQQPRLLLADEPVANLDPVRADEILELLDRAAGPGALVVSLHDPGRARQWCTRLIGLADGRVVFDSPETDVGDDQVDALYRSRPGPS